MLTVYRDAMRQRDAYNKWCAGVAVLLGIEVGSFRSAEVADNYAELRERITAKLSLNNEARDGGFPSFETWQRCAAAWNQIAREGACTA